MKEKYLGLYLGFARQVAQMSHAQRLKVGAVAVNEDTLVYGYNGTPSGWPNECEDKEYMDSSAGGWLDTDEILEQWPYQDEQGRYRLVTKPEVLHAEMNCLAKLSKSPLKSKGSVMFLTHSPCIHCAKAMYQIGISKVYYETDYRSHDGVEFLEKCGVEVIKV